MDGPPGADHLRPGGVRHLHSATDIVSTRYLGGLRYVTYSCECGVELPERLG